MIELIIGGARSGKSGYALSVAEAIATTDDVNLHFIATAEARDEEMSRRIERHQRERGARWHVIEEPRYLSRLTESFVETDVVLVDCLTLWLSNWLCSDTLEQWTEQWTEQKTDQCPEQWTEQKTEQWQAEKQIFQRGLQQSPAHWLLVSNEVGMGITPTNRLSRQFIDESGWLHQQFAQIASRVTVVKYGIPQILK